MDIKALQEDVDDKKAELETLLYVGYFRHAYATILSIPRLQIYSYILAFVCLVSLLRQLALHLQYICGTGPADVPHEGGDDKVHVDEAALSPQGHRSVDYKTSKCEDRSWTSSSQQRWSVLGFTQYGSSCLEKDDDDFKNLSASLILCTASQSCAAAKRVHVDSK